MADTAIESETTRGAQDERVERRRRAGGLAVLAAVLGLGGAAAAQTVELAPTLVPRRCCPKLCPRLLGVDVKGDQLVRFDLEAGAATPVGPLNVGDVTAASLDSRPDGALFGMLQISGMGGNLVRIDPRSGQGVVLGNPGVGGGGGIAFGAGCTRLYQLSSDELRVIDTTALTATVSTVSGLSVTSLARSPVGYFAVDRASDLLLRVDVLTGATPATVMDVGALLGRDVHVDGLAYDRATGHLFAADNVLDRLLEIDPWTGTVRELGGYGLSGGSNIVGLAFEASDFAQR